eukprot:TRINITY_DN12527_c0_g1_i1.p1 TRINITY_DN12527_c0_g1~~TRINITY_DN12527_c0_g1_i1.p1  ORF type:complete len:299 (+),score=40.53 TRINITY_DN12527_c0_g1_i1:26-922(+)
MYTLIKNWQDLVTKTAAAPFERIKILLQVQGELAKSGRLAQPYNGAIDCVQRTVKQEGISSLWHALLPQVLRTLLTDNFNHYFNDFFRKLNPAILYKRSEHYWKWFLGSLISGGFAGMSSLLFVYPLDYATTRLSADIVQSTQGGTRQYENIQDLITKTIASDGIAGLYQGFMVSCLGILAYRAAYFGLYDSLSPVVLHRGQKKPSLWKSFLFGWGVTMAAGLVTYPLDTIRRRQMMTCGESFKYSSAWNAFTEITAKEGVSGLFGGALVNIVRAMVGAATLTLCDYLITLQPNNQKQ